MDCKNFEMQILGGVAVNQDSREAEALREHLVLCASCRSFHQAVQSGFQGIVSRRRLVNDPTLLQKIQKRMLSAESRKPATRRQAVKVIKLGFPLAMAAASVLLGLWLGGRILSFTLQPSAETVSAVTTPQLYALEIHMKDESTEFIENYLSGN